MYMGKTPGDGPHAPLDTSSPWSVPCYRYSCHSYGGVRAGVIAVIHAAMVELGVYMVGQVCLQYTALRYGHVALRGTSGANSTDACVCACVRVWCVLRCTSFLPCTCVLSVSYQELAIAKAKECGCAWVVARNSNHYGIAGW